MKFGFMDEKGIYDVLILRMLQEEYHANGKKLHVICGARESPKHITKKVLKLAMRKKGIP